MTNNRVDVPVTVAIAVPLEPEHVSKIRAVAADAKIELNIRYEPELLPPRKYPSDHIGAPGFARTSEQQRRYWTMLESAHVLYGFPDASAESLQRLLRLSNNLRWVHAMAAGAGTAMVAAGITAQLLSDRVVTTSAGVHAVPLAEWAMAAVSSSFKRFPELASAQKRREWPEILTPHRTLRGSHLVIAGLGELGSEIARLACALGMRVSGTMRTPRPVPGVQRVVTNDLLPTLVDKADAVVITLPGTSSTTGLFDRELFGAFRADTTLVNIGRGTVIDEDALMWALDHGRVAHAYLDVFAVEPLPADHPLWSHPAVLVSPHAASSNVEETRLIVDRFCANLLKYAAAQPMPHTVDVDLGY
ncbi:D-2-hydroxyacid dehydrogenase [Mycolicibacterium sp. HK-90]|uniref:D-2-hydroxyacid dehydrogenase n=1 Tax=Mycolicibacterium sp. HK-90 TaxID=3056937 RepID=UPI0026587C22|nr:D-2-hydroxyacid dehydrogenase [Mycolicibacterium sp. HK-90]WKG03965.1 D-2-hydroxyacid dehydrogenase [Mycolicibacterium sp. HK-90]